MTERPTDRGAFAWVAAVFGALIVGGFVLVLWAINTGQAPDQAASPFHLPLYLGVAALAIFSLARAVRAQARGSGWRHAFPDGYGLLGAGAATLIGGLFLDLGWREGVGLAYRLEESFAPSRVLITIGLGMIAAAPLSAALQLGNRMVPTLPVLLSAALTIVALGWPGGFQPAQSAWLAVDPELPQPPVDLWVMDPDGGRQTRLVEAGEGNGVGYASWAPDGSRIAYTRFGLPASGVAASVALIWSAAADGSDARSVLDGDEWRWIPRYTADGAWMLFTQEAQGGPWMEEGPVGPGVGAGPQGPLNIPLPNADIWRIASTGEGDAVRLTDNAGDDRAPVPSPDGSLVLFDSTRDGNTELYVIGFDGSDPRRLTDDPGEDWGGTWSPDGRQIAFNSTRSGQMEIYVMDADGTDVRQVTFDQGFNSSPTWAPDGSRIAFTTRGPDDYGQIWSISVDGSDRRNLSRSPSSDDQIWTGGWGPDGRIVFGRGMPPPAEATALARLDLGTAGTLLSLALMAAVVVALGRIAPPLGSFTLVLALATVLIAVPSQEWRFVAAGFAAGLAADLAAWLAPERHRARVTGAASAAMFVITAGAIANATTGLEWTPTLVLGVAVAAGAIGWGLGVVASLDQRREATAPP
ncbi:MAG TPA: hypothetical protein VI277_05605 [Candidatus Limnocylindria bacterium]